MDNITFIKAIIERQLLSEIAARKLLNEAALLKRNIEDIVYERRILPEETIADLKSQILGIPYKKIKPEEIADDVLKLVPEETVRNYKIIPISRSGDTLVVGMVSPDDQKSVEAVKFIAKQARINLGVYLTIPSVWEAVLRRYSPYKDEVAAAVKSLNLENRKAGAQRVVQLEGENTALASEDAPIIRIVASTLKEAVWQKASDIHIEPQRERLRIRFRVDGDLREVSSMPIELHQSIVSRVKVLSSLKIDEARVPQDGRFRAVVFGRDIDFRVSTFPTPVGEKTAIRVLDPLVGLRGLEELGLLRNNMEILKQAAEKPYGMILITGPTGSGKTTTLYAIMQGLNQEDVNVISLEDPVEYFIDGLNQSQIRSEIGYDFASGLRQILRQDPDVIMVGEIRDNETAALAVHAALTGHIVLSTLHTNSATGVIPRLVDMKVEPFLLPSSLNLMMAQRLISKICQQCKKMEKPSPEIEAIIKKELENVPKKIIEDCKLSIENLNIYRSSGCQMCKNKGIGGRIALYEILEMTDALKQIITKGIDESKIIEESKKQSMLTLRQDGILKALQGIVSIEEVLKETMET